MREGRHRRNKKEGRKRTDMKGGAEGGDANKAPADRN